MLMFSVILYYTREKQSDLLFKLIITFVLTVVVTHRGSSCPLPRKGAVPLGWPVQSEAFLAGEALGPPNPKPLLPGPEVAVIQLELSRAQQVWGWCEIQMMNLRSLLSCSTSKHITFAGGSWHLSATGCSHRWPLPIWTTKPVAGWVRVLAQAAVVGQNTALQPSLYGKHMFTFRAKLSNAKLSSKEKLYLFRFPDLPFYQDHKSKPTISGLSLTFTCRI